MPYTVVMTKDSVSKNTTTGIYTINVRCVINDGTADVFNEVVSAKYNPKAPNLSAMKTAILAALQRRWDKQTDEKVVFDSAAFDAAVADMQTTATAYVNA